MKINEDMLKKGLGAFSILVAGVVAVANAIADQKKAEEFDGLKKAVEELQNQNK